MKIKMWNKYMACVFIMVSNLSFAVQLQPIEFKNGVNDFFIKKIHIRIIKGKVSLLSSNDFQTYTAYMFPLESKGEWKQIPFDNRKPPVDYFFYTIESADSNVQSIAFYKKNEQLFVVKATKTGMLLPDLNLKKTPVIFHTYKFNENDDVPRFMEVDTQESKKIYLDAINAIKEEVFGG